MQDPREKCLTVNHLWAAIPNFRRLHSVRGSTHGGVPFTRSVPVQAHSSWGWPRVAGLAQRAAGVTLGPCGSPVCVCACSVVSDSVTTGSVAHQAPLSMGFSRQKFWSGLLFPSLGDLPDPEIAPMFPPLAGRFFTTTPLEKPVGSCWWEAYLGVLASWTLFPENLLGSSSSAVFLISAGIIWPGWFCWEFSHGCFSSLPGSVVFLPRSFPWLLSQVLAYVFKDLFPT